MKINRLLTLTVLSFLCTACTQEFAEPEGSLDVLEVDIRGVERDTEAMWPGAYQAE